LRYVKDEAEVAAIRRAIEIADAAYSDFTQWVKPGMLEREVAARLEFFQRNMGGARKESETIVASGPRTAMPHGVATEREILANEPVMIDIGIVVDGYTSDLTRTIHLGSPPAEFEKIYQIVLDAQTKAEEGIRLGMTGREVDAIARQHITDKGYGEYFGHMLGHSVGLQIHERPNFSPAEDVKIEPGMVVTVEPGIYLPGKFGVRIEDIVLITDDGCEVLTRSPHELKVI
jgi:Xaa-Pro aminopeptidase